MWPLTAVAPGAGEYRNVGALSADIGGRRTQENKIKTAGGTKGRKDEMELVRIYINFSDGELAGNGSNLPKYF